MDKKRRGPKPKTLKTATYSGIEVGRGENRQVIDPEEVYKLARLGCNYEEMSDWFQIPANTLKYNFSDIIAKGRSELKQSLRRAQLQAAMNLQPTLLVWLGKNLLGQSDSPNVESADEKILPWCSDTDRQSE